MERFAQKLVSLDQMTFNQLIDTIKEAQTFIKNNSSVLSSESLCALKVVLKGIKLSNSRLKNRESLKSYAESACIVMFASNMGESQHKDELLEIWLETRDTPSVETLKVNNFEDSKKVIKALESIGTEGALKKLDEIWREN
jgi:S-adenosylmethionine:tRNA-ribosyltransferase-isomerase (queuine synthetase)